MVSNWPWMTFHRLCVPMAWLYCRRKRRPTARLTQQAVPSTPSTPVSPRTETKSILTLCLIEAACWSLTAPQEEPDANREDASSTSSTRASVGDDPVEKASTRSSGLMDSPGKEEQNEANNPCKPIKRSRLMSSAIQPLLSYAHLSFSASFSCSCLCQRAVYRDKPGGCGAEWTEHYPSRKLFICPPLLQLSHLLTDLAPPSRDQHPCRARKIMIPTNQDSVSWQIHKASWPKWWMKKRRQKHSPRSVSLH